MSTVTVLLFNSIHPLQTFLLNSYLSLYSVSKINLTHHHTPCCRLNLIQSRVTRNQTITQPGVNMTNLHFMIKTQRVVVCCVSFCTLHNFTRDNLANCTCKWTTTTVTDHLIKMLVVAITNSTKFGPLNSNTIYVHWKCAQLIQLMTNSKRHCV